MSTKLQEAVSIVLGAGHQLDADAFRFLESFSQKQDPTKLIEAVVKKIESLPQKPLVIELSLLEETMKSCFTTKEETSQVSSTSFIGSRKTSIYPYAKGVESDVRIINDPTDNICSTGSINQYLSYFQDRFKRIKRIFRQRVDAKDSVPISVALKVSINTRVKMIGLITEKREYKKMILFKLEDLENKATILVPQNAKPKLKEKIQALLIDQVVCISAIKGRNDLFIVKDLILPDMPQKEPRKASIPVYAALISDLHVGSKMFMAEELNRFALWLDGKFGNHQLKEIASHVKYVVIAGDLVDGIGIYPGQLEELEINDIYKQYQAMSKFIELLPPHIDIIVIPGNHDASRKAMPQPAISRDYLEPLHEARKIYSLGNPCTVRLHGVELLLSHGRSLDDVIANVPNVNFNAPDKAMKYLLKSRHLAPTYGQRTSIAPENRDFMVIERVPDIFHCGHIHVMRFSSYRGILTVNSGAWQEQTGYQRKMGLNPTPAIVPVVDLQTLQVWPINFNTLS